MAVLGTTDYTSIMTDYANALTQLTGISDHYFNSAYTVLITNVFDPEIDLLVAFHNAYIVSQRAFATVPQSAVTAINTLQKHILSHSISKGNIGAPLAGEKYDDINDYYIDNPNVFKTGINAIIPSAFATISSQSGHVIDATYVI